MRNQASGLCTRSNEPTLRDGLHEGLLHRILRLSQVTAKREQLEDGSRSYDASYSSWRNPDPAMVHLLAPAIVALTTR